MGMQYSEELANWARQRMREKHRQDVAAVAFMAVKSRVVEALDAGFTLTTIWEHLVETGKLKCSYETFRRHVHRFITSVERSRDHPKNPSRKSNGDGANQSTSSRRNTTRAASPDPSKALSPGLPGFKFNAAPKQEDLI